MQKTSTILQETAHRLSMKWDKSLLTKRETAKELSVSPATVDRLRKDGLISSKKVLGQIMFSVDEIARFIADI